MIMLRVSHGAYISIGSLRTTKKTSNTRTPRLHYHFQTPLNIHLFSEYSITDDHTHNTLATARAPVQYIPYLVPIHHSDHT